MKITDLRCAVIGENPVIRITTDAGIDGYGQAENTKPYLKPFVLFYKQYLIGEDPTNVERVMLKIRRLASFKPWGAAVSAIEMALLDITGKAYRVPVYKLLGGKIRDQVRVYNGGVRWPMQGYNPEDYAADVIKMKESKEAFSIIKIPIGFHSPMVSNVPGFFYGEIRGGAPHAQRGPMTEKGMHHMEACVKAIKEVLRDEIGLALDCGPGWLLPDAIRIAKALEPYNLLWMEDMLTGDYTPYTLAKTYRDLTISTSTPIHTGEQIYLRQNFMELIENQAVRVVGPDPEDVGGLTELKWIAEYADLHGILMAPHGVFDGLIGLAGLVQVCATMPSNFIAFEYPIARPAWWYEIVEGLPDLIVKDSLIEVWDRPGLGVNIIPSKAKKYLMAGDEGFFD